MYEGHREAYLEELHHRDRAPLTLLDAELKLVEPAEKAQFLARWSEAKLSLIQRSHPTPPEGVEAEVVYIGKGEEQKDYKGLDVAGKMVLTDGDVTRVYRLAVEERGARGLIYYGTWVKEPDPLEGELDDALTPSIKI